MFRLTLSEEEVLLLDDYFTRRVGYIGREHPADQAAHQLANIIAAKAKEICEQSRSTVKS
jgi:hypothetical protein